MDLDLLAESDSDSDSNHSNQDQDNASQDQDATNGRRSAVTAATAGSDAGTEDPPKKPSSLLKTRGPGSNVCYNGIKALRTVFTAGLRWGEVFYRLWP